MDNPLATRIRLLHAAAARDEVALARQRVAIEALRSEGHRTAEAEKSYEKFKTLHQGLLEKLAVLRREEVSSRERHCNPALPAPVITPE
jgi:hypothetical protein